MAELLRIDEPIPYLAPKEVPTYKIEVFEGPLDLLLSLVAKHKMKIEDIQISLLCEQYMAYLAQAEKMDLELSSEFIVMASELMLIKSKMLLPRTSEEEEDPRAALAAAMLEYQRSKEAAVILSDLYKQYGGRMAKDTDEITVDKTFVADQEAQRLSEVLLRMLSQPPPPTDDAAKKTITPLIQTKIVPVPVKIISIMRHLRRNGRTKLVSLFESAQSRSELVALFMAVLELLRGQRLAVTTDEEYAESGVVDVCSVQLELLPAPDRVRTSPEHKDDE